MLINGRVWPSMAEYGPLCRSMSHMTGYDRICACMAEYEIYLSKARYGPTYLSMALRPRYDPVCLGTLDMSYHIRPRSVTIGYIGPCLAILACSCPIPILAYTYLFLLIPSYHCLSLKIQLFRMQSSYRELASHLKTYSQNYLRGFDHLFLSW